MPEIVDGKTFYRTNEAAKLAGISKPTLLRWIREGRIADVKIRDRRNWRLFTEAEVQRLKKFAQAVRTS